MERYTGERNGILQRIEDKNCVWAEESSAEFFRPLITFFLSFRSKFWQCKSSVGMRCIGTSTKTEPSPAGYGRKAGSAGAAEIPYFKPEEDLYSGTACK